MTGQMYLDVANVFLKMEKREEGIRFLEKAFEIFEITRHDDGIEKASLANQIAVILFEFGSYEEAITFAKKSNEFFALNEEPHIIRKILDNKLVIAKSRQERFQHSQSLEECEKAFNLATKRSVWEPRLGKYIVEILKVTIKILLSKVEHRMRCSIYYIFSLVHLTYKNQKAIVHDQNFLVDLKEVCELHKDCTNFVRSLIGTVERFQDVFDLSNLVNVKFEEFKQLHQIDEILTAMDDFKRIYLCLGPEFLLHEIKPVA